MDIKNMYDEFREQYPKLAEVVDIRHTEIWDSVGHETMFLWFETLSGALNDLMGIPEHQPQFDSIFQFFEKKFRTGDERVKNCIEVSLIENLFWEVRPENTGPVWAVLPKSLQQQYINFHGQPPQ